ncbi:MAG: hypothetical protein ACYDBJ_16605 [Aggregatilineales bacterium]
MGYITRALRMRVQIAKAISAAVLSLTVLWSGVGHAAQAQNFQSPQAMLLAYYSAVNLRNYPQAYGYWLNPTQAYADFASGFLTTTHVLPYLGDWQPAPASAPAGELGRIPAVLIGYQTDSGPVAYSGCFNIGQTSVTWRIVGASFSQDAAAGNVPDRNSINSVLAVNCYQPTGLTALNVVSAAPNKGRAMLEGYYRLINQRDYTHAYAEWLQPIAGPKPNGAPPADYRLPYADFVAGYADTVYAYAFLGAYDEGGASAGHGYLDGTIPAVLIGYHTDGSVVAFYGCYVLGNLQNGQLGIVSGTFLPFQTPTIPNGSAILAKLGTDCTTLNLSF